MHQIDVVETRSLQQVIDEVEHIDRGIRAALLPLELVREGVPGGERNVHGVAVAVLGVPDAGRDAERDFDAGPTFGVAVAGCAPPIAVVRPIQPDPP